MFTRSHIFRAAWKIARTLASKSGRSAKAEFGEALRQAWEASRLTKPVPADGPNMIVMLIEIAALGLRQRREHGSLLEAGRQKRAMALAA